jgi:FkbM family methyltransferase
MRHSLLHTVGNAVWVARTDRQAARSLLASYVRLKLGEIAASRRPHAGGTSRTKVLDWDVRFFDHYWLVEMFEEIFLRQQYRFESSARNPFVVDVGSNIGLSILYFKHLYPDARIVGFEPDRETYEVLAENMRMNRCGDVVLFNTAISDSVGSVTLYHDTGTPGSPRQSTRKERLNAEVGIEVPSAPLSDYLAEPVDYLKLDVEGAEGVVLSDLERSSKLQLVRKMTVEYHHHLHGEDDGLADVLAMLQRNDFAYQLEARLGPRRRDGMYQNILVHAYSKAAQPVDL